jgi:hypothetical protein
LHPNEEGVIPLIKILTLPSIRGFKLFFDYGIRYYPKKKGINLLFRKNNDGTTPFQFACRTFGYDEVMKIIDDTLARYSDTPVNVAEALLSAVIDENIHLECSYFLLRRQPDILVKLLLSAPAAVVAAAGSNNNNNNAGDEGNDGNSNVLIKRALNSKKRKR